MLHVQTKMYIVCVIPYDTLYIQKLIKEIHILLWNIVTHP